MTDLTYALIQLLHNLGAVAVVGLPITALVLERQGIRLPRWVVLALCAAWALQALSGIGFGVASLGLKGALPEIEGVAKAALAVKIAGTAVGCFAAALAWRSAAGWSLAARRRFLRVEVAAALFPLAAAAFLRWYL